MNFRVRNDLISTEVQGEMVIFDPSSNQAHSLNPEATRVFKLCQSGESLDLEDPSVLPTLQAFREQGLLSEGGGDQKTTRREALSTMAKTAALPVMMSIAITSPAAAASTGISELDCETSGGTACGTLCVGPFPFGSRVCGSTSGVPGGLCGCVPVPAACGCV